VKSFEVASVMGENGTLLRGGKQDLKRIGLAEVVRLASGTSKP
jgi:hypothetical protein